MAASVPVQPVLGACSTTGSVSSSHQPLPILTGLFTVGWVTPLWLMWNFLVQRSACCCSSLPAAQAFSVVGCAAHGPRLQADADCRAVAHAAAADPRSYLKRTLSSTSLPVQSPCHAFAAQPQPHAPLHSAARSCAALSSA
jgi:hypothetical protein